MERVLLDVKPRPSEQRQLDERFDVSHAVAFHLHDQLGRLLAELERVDALSVSFPVEDEERDELEGLSGDELWNWLQSSGRTDVVADLSYRQLTAAVLADALHFICESLIASGKGKTTVAYSLLRKPFKESLLLFEWLLVDPGGFLAQFHGETTQGYVLNRLSKEQRMRILEAAASEVELPISAEHLWTIRYAKEYPNSLETLWTKATHLVTTVHASKTEPGNLNFVFSGASAVEEQWEHYYSILPLLLTYLCSVVERVAGRFFKWNESAARLRTVTRLVAFARHCQVAGASAELQQLAEQSLTGLFELTFDCDHCRDTFSIESDAVDRFWLREEVICPRCGNAMWLQDMLDDGGSED